WIRGSGCPMENKMLWGDGRARFGILVIGLIVLAAVFAPLLTRAEPAQVGILAMALSVLLGLFVGAIAGVFQRRTGTLLMGATDFALALPRVVLLLLL